MAYNSTDQIQNKKDICLGNKIHLAISSYLSFETDVAE